MAANDGTYPTSINEFIKRFTSVRPTLYRVRFVFGGNDVSKFLSTGNHWLNSSQAFQDIYIYCKGARLPSSKLNELEVSYFGRKFFDATEKDFEPLELTFYNSQDFAIRNFIERWMDNINLNIDLHQLSDDGTPTGGKYDYFMPTLEVEQLDRRNNKLQTYTFLYVYPLSCSEVSLDFSTQNAIEEFTVSFRYEWWQHKDHTSNKSEDTDVVQGVDTPIPLQIT